MGLADWVPEALETLDDILEAVAPGTLHPDIVTAASADADYCAVAGEDVFHADGDIQVAVAYLGGESGQGLGVHFLGAPISDSALEGADCFDLAGSDSEYCVCVCHFLVSFACLDVLSIALLADMSSGKEENRNYF